VELFGREKGEASHDLPRDKREGVGMNIE